MAKIFSVFSVLLFLILGCTEPPKKTKRSEKKVEQKQKFKKKKLLLKDPEVYLDENTAIPFLFDYQKKDRDNQVRITTEYGDIDILLYEDTPYHRANFIYLTKLGYFNNTFFHRVVPDFVIQGGNSDHPNTWSKRRKIGRYLLPQDNRKGHKHDRGVISIPSSEEENPHKLASPYEFFIVQQKGGAYHLDKNFTPFGKVIKGMDVVDKICAQPIDKRESPIKNILMKVSIIN
ncbi:peptidylprolyl isomerase [Flavobacteriaceae bacterium]|nr:peptidylprolyl isomerase [Flavobacteriaceae bacterium]MDB4715838.1 peptidylprolyl isomerase [Flavobacteriaceae bacterium]